MNEFCAIISGGEFSPLEGIEKADFVIACDKGLKYALDCGLKPDLIIGDFDSYTGQIPQDIPVLKLPEEKDDTDTGIAFNYAAEKGYKKIELYCALGGRLDHLLGNIQTASVAVKNGALVHINSKNTEIYIMSNYSLQIPEKEAFSLSVIALSDSCSGVTIKGTKYELKNVTMHNTGSLGISNQWRGCAEISVKEGILMVVMSKM